MNIEKMLAECRAHWEKARPDAVFADYWIGWQASREFLSAENEKLIKRVESLTYDRADLRDKIEALRGMLPECKNCQGGGQVNDGFCSFDCWECGGTGCSSST